MEKEVQYIVVRIYCIERRLVEAGCARELICSTTVRPAPRKPSSCLLTVYICPRSEPPPYRAVEASKCRGLSMIRLILGLSGLTLLLQIATSLRPFLWMLGFFKLSIYFRGKLVHVNLMPFFLYALESMLLSTYWYYLTPSIMNLLQDVLK